MAHAGRNAIGIAAVTALLGAGCGHDRGELYRDKMPLLPALPEALEPCRECVRGQAECMEIRAACLRDAPCSKLLACAGACNDLGCLAGCQQEEGIPPLYEDLWACAFIDHCGAECGSGENWNCSGDYTWPKVEKGHDTFSVRYHFRTAALSGAFAVGATVTLCAAVAGVACTPLATGPVDAWNTVDLTVRTGGFDDIRGHLRIEDALSGAFGWQDRVYSYPVSRPVQVELFPPSRDALSFLSPGLDVDRGAPLALYLGDCLGLPARSVGVRFLDAEEIGVRYLDTLELITAEEGIGFAFVPDVPEPYRNAPIAVELHDLETGRRVAQRGFSVQAGWTTHVILWPLEH